MRTRSEDVARPWWLRSVLAGISGLILTGAFDPLAQGWLVVPALALLVVALDGARTWHAAVAGSVFGYSFMGPLIWWIQQSRGTVAWVALVTSQAAWLCLMAVVLAKLMTLRGWPLWGAATWSTFEGLRSTQPLGGFPWGRLGEGVVETPWAGLLPYLGVGGTGFGVFAAVATSVWALTMVSGRLKGALPLGLMTLVWSLTFLPTVAPYRLPAEGQVDVGVVQGGVPGDGNDVVANAGKITDNHRSVSTTLAHAVRSGRLRRPAFTIWPENSTAVDPGRDSHVNSDITAAVEALGMPLLVGQITEAPGGRTIYNQGVVRLPRPWAASSSVAQRYTKHHPVPFGEYLPFRSVFGGLSDQFDQIPRDMLPGTSTQPLTIAGISVADAICFDVAYDDVIEPQVRRGASLVVVQTSNASFFGTDQLAQQFTITRARALTTGRTLLVSSLNGITAAIDADGTVIRRAPMGVTTAMVVSAPLRNGLTPAVRWQTWLEAAPKSLWALAVLAWLRRRRQSRGRPQFRA